MRRAAAGRSCQRRTFARRTRDVHLSLGYGRGHATATLGVELSPINVQVDGNTEDAVSEFARDRNDGMIVVVSSTATIQRDLLIKLAARYRLPAVYPYRFFVDAGGLMSYGPNLLDGYRRSASYVDRILKGEKPADLPVQAPTKKRRPLPLT